MSSVTVEAALAAAEVGVKVFPLVKGSKVPHSKASHPNAQKANATTDETIIRGWAAEFPGCNWGGLLPPEMILIDVDLEDDGGPNEWASRPEIAEELTSAFIAVETPNGGKHYVFAQPEPGRWTGGNGSEKTVPHVDTRSGDSFYFVLPGCWAATDGEDGRPGPLKAYRFAAGKWVESLDLTAPGSLISGFLDQYYRTDGSRPASRVGKVGSNVEIPVGEVCLDNLSAYINTSPGWQQVAIQAFMRGEGVTVYECGADGVIRFQRPGSDNPWGATFGTRESRHGISGTAKKAMGYPRLYCWSPNWIFASEWSADGRRKGYSTLDLIQLYYQDDRVELDQIMEEAAVLYRNLTIDESDFIDEPDFDEASTGVDEGPADQPGLGDLASSHERMANEVIASCREGGFLKTFWSEMERIEFRSQPVFRLAGGLVALSGLIGRKVTTANGDMSNLLACCLAQTGMGKESARGLVARLLDSVLPGVTATGNARMVRRCGLPHSGSGLFNVLAQAPARVMVCDEIGSLLESGAKDQNGLQGTLLATLVETFTTGTGWIHPRERADRVVNAPPVQAPFLSLLGFTQPEKMGAIISASTIELGLVPRMLIFRGRDGVPLKKGMENVNVSELPAELVEMARAWQTFQPSPDPTDPSRLTFARWTLTVEAGQLLAVLTNHFESLLLEANRTRSASAACFTRAVQIIKRLALVFAADRLETPREDWTIEQSDVYSASVVLNACLENVTHHITHEMTTSEADEVIKKTEAYLKRVKKTSPETWVTISEISKNVRHKLLDNTNGRKLVMTTLQDDGVVEIRKVNIKGMERTQYRYIC